MDKKIKKKLELQLVLLLTAYTIAGAFGAMLLDYCGANSRSPLLNALILREDLLLLLYIIIGYAAIFFIYWRKNCGYLDDVVAAIEVLHRQDNTPIVLANPLKETADYMNRIKMDVLLANQAIAAEEKRKNEMIAYLAHDIRTPLTSIIGYLNLLDEMPELGSAKRVEYIQKTLDQAGHLEALVNEFFEISQYNTGELTLARKNIDLHYLFLQLEDEFLPVLNKNGNTLKLEMDEKLPVNADGDRLSRAFANLLKNAVLYSFPGTEITIFAKIANGWLTVTIQNHGKTLSREELGTIFDKFSRLNRARQSDGSGAGLGLPIAKEIIKLHNGTIEAKSSGDTISFIIRLPLPGQG